MSHVQQPAMTQAEYARHAGVNRSQITRWLQSGRITALPSGLIDPVAADAQRTATESPMPHHQARKAQIDAEKAARTAGAENAATASQAPGMAYGHNPPARTQPAPTDMPTAGMPALEKIGAALKLETWKLQKAKAERENMELDLRAGALVERTEMDFVLADFGSTARTIHDAYPDRYTHELVALGIPAAKAGQFLSELGRASNEELAEHMKRKMETAA